MADALHLPTMSNASAETIHDKHLRLWGIPSIVVAALLGLMPFFYPGRWDLFGWYLVAGLIYTSVTWEACRWVMIRVRRQMPGMENTGRRILRTTLLYTLIAALGQLILNAIFYRWGLTPPVLAESSFFKLWFINFLSALFFVFLNSSIYEALYFFSQYKYAIQKAEHLKTQQAQQRLDALKSRVNPHFLFNSLTTLSALIGEDAPRAERFVDELAKVYRYLLRAGRQPVVALESELEFAGSYAFLLKNRFEEGAFSFADNCPSDIKSPPQSGVLGPSLPALTFQNSLDYLVRTQNVPLHIRAEILDNQLRIICKHQPKTLTFDTSGNDWRQLEAAGARHEIKSGDLAVLVPFTSNPTAYSAPQR